MRPGRDALPGEAPIHAPDPPSETRNGSEASAPASSRVTGIDATVQAANPSGKPRGVPPTLAGHPESEGSSGPKAGPVPVAMGAVTPGRVGAEPGAEGAGNSGAPDGTSVPSRITSSPPVGDCGSERGGASLGTGVKKPPAGSVGRARCAATSGLSTT